MNYIIELAEGNNPTPGVVTLDLSWASDVLALIGIISAIFGVIALWVRHEVKNNFNDIKAEFKPNGGGSLKDQVNRLESRHDELDGKVDKIIDVLVGKKSPKLDTEEIQKLED